MLYARLDVRALNLKSVRENWLMTDIFFIIIDNFNNRISYISTLRFCRYFTLSYLHKDVMFYITNTFYIASRIFLCILNFFLSKWFRCASYHFLWKTEHVRIQVDFLLLIHKRSRYTLRKNLRNQISDTKMLKFRDNIVIKMYQLCEMLYFF